MIYQFQFGIRSIEWETVALSELNINQLSMSYETTVVIAFQGTWIVIVYFSIESILFSITYEQL